MNYWLLKTEPDCFSYADLEKAGKTTWDGVRNYTARNNLNSMVPGDLALFYHSISDKAIVGIARVISLPYADPTTDDDRWVVVDVEPVTPMKQPVYLKDIKADPELQNIPLVRLSRLSVMPLEEEVFAKLCRMGDTAVPALAE